VLAKELGPRNIRVNSINPGMIETEGVHAAGFIGSDFQKMVEAQSPLGRVGQPEDIAPTAVLSGVVGLEVHDRGDAGGVAGLKVAGSLQRGCVTALSRPSEFVDAVIDTGFTGFVQLPERRTRLTRLVSRLTQLVFRETFILSSRGIERYPYAPLDIAATASENPSAGWKPKERGEDGRRKRRLRFLRLTWLPGSSSSGTAQSTESTPHDYKLWSHHHDVR